MKFVRFFAVMFVLPLLAATTAQAMTVQEFFSMKDVNIRLVQHVLKTSQTTGVRKQLDDTKQLLAIAEKETVPDKKEGAAKLAWFFALHIDYQAGTTLPEAEAAPFQKEAEQAGFRAAQIMQIARQDLGPLADGTFKLFGEVAAMGQAGQGQKATPSIKSEHPQIREGRYTARNGSMSGLAEIKANSDGSYHISINTTNESNLGMCEGEFTGTFRKEGNAMIAAGDGFTISVSNGHLKIHEAPVGNCGRGASFLENSVYTFEGDGATNVQGSVAPQKTPKRAQGSEEQKISDLLQVAQNINAKSERARGKSFPILTANAQALQQFDRKLFDAMRSQMNNISSAKDPVEQHFVMAQAWDSIGYSLDATLRDTFSAITPDQYFRSQRDGTFNVFLASLQLFKDEATLKAALEKGALSRDTAVAFCSASLRYIEAVTRVQQ